MGMDGRLWVADNAEDFRRCSLTHRCTTSKAGTKYPATLITTADHDDRVVSAHSFKYAAALQRAQEGPAPILIRIETKAGTGGEAHLEDYRRNGGPLGVSGERVGGE